MVDPIVAQQKPKSQGFSLCLAELLQGRGQICHCERSEAISFYHRWGLLRPENGLAMTDQAPIQQPLPGGAFAAGAHLPESLQRESIVQYVHTASRNAHWVLNAAFGKVSRGKWIHSATVLRRSCHGFASISRRSIGRLIVEAKAGQGGQDEYAIGHTWVDAHRSIGRKRGVYRTRGQSEHKAGSRGGVEVVLCSPQHHILERASGQYPPLRAAVAVPTSRAQGDQKG